MNILFYQDTSGVSGAEIWIADAARRLRERGHGVSLSSPGDSWMACEGRHHGFPVIDFHSGPGFDAHRRWVLADHIARESVDVVLCSIPGARMEVPLLDRAVRDAGRGRIVVRLGVAPGEKAFPPERVGYGCDTVDEVVVVSHDVKRHLLHNFPMLDGDRIHVVYNGVDLDRFAPDVCSDVERAALRRDLGIPGAHRVVAAIGRLDPVKNLPALIDAADTILRRHPDTTFLIAGEGAARDPLQMAIASKGLDSAFRFTGFVKDIPRLLSIVDIVVHPSMSEGVPNTLLEAMAAGKAVVATRVGGIGEVIDGPEVGLLVHPGDRPALAGALCALLSDDRQRTDLGRAARAHVAVNYDRNVNIEQIECLFQSVAERAAAPGPAAPRVLYDPPFALTARDTLLRA